MAKAPKVYSRVSRYAIGLGGSLWLATDHLLIVSNFGIAESYARVLLRDIKGLFVVRTRRQIWWGIPWTLLLLVFGIRALVVIGYGEVPYASGPLALIFALALAWNFILGAGCRVYVVTGVRTALLPSLVRRKKTRRVLLQLEPLIKAAQRDLVGPPVAPAPVTASESNPTGLPDAAPAEPPVSP